MRCLKPQAHHCHAQRTALESQCAIPEYIVAALSVPEIALLIHSKHTNGVIPRWLPPGLSARAA